MAKGLLAYIYRDGMGDCTNHGLTSRVQKVILTGVGVPEIFEPTTETPELVLKTKNVGGVYHYAEPSFSPKPGHLGWMNGGNFVYTSDSRFPTGRPIPVHDRQETPELYDLLSR